MIRTSSKFTHFLLDNLNLIILTYCIDKICKPICIVFIIHVKVSLKDHQLIQSVNNLLYSFFFSLNQILMQPPHLFIIPKLKRIKLTNCSFKLSSSFLSLSHFLIHLDKCFWFINALFSLFDSAYVKLFDCFLII